MYVLILFYFLIIDNRRKIPQTVIIFSLPSNSGFVWEVEVLRGPGSLESPHHQAEAAEYFSFACLLSHLALLFSKVAVHLRTAGHDLYGPTGRGFLITWKRPIFEWIWEALAFHRERISDLWLVVKKSGSFSCGQFLAYVLSRAESPPSVLWQTEEWCLLTWFSPVVL